MYRLHVENERKEKIELTNSPYFTVVDVDGILPTKASLSTTKLANRDGSVLNSASLENRDIAITIQPEIPVEENRQKLYRYFRNKREVTLYYKNENRDVMTTGIVENFDGSLFEQTQKIVITILCTNPYLIDRKGNVESMENKEDLFEFPFAIASEGKEFSRINKETVKRIENKGDTETGMIIELMANGEVKNPTIHNVDTREHFGLKIDMERGDVIRINTNSSRKRVELERDGVTRNIINNIVKGNKWLGLEPGSNAFTYTCDSGEEYLSVKFLYSHMYEGV